MSLLEECKSSVSRVQQIDPTTLARREQLGDELNFAPAELPAKKTIDLFHQLPIEQLSYLPEPQLQTVKNAADAFFNIIEQTREFKTSAPNALAQRDSIISQVNSSHYTAFNDVFQIISYISSRQSDFGALEREARAKIQQANDRANELSRALEVHETEAKRVLEEIKKVAAEQGISQHSHYYKIESENHSKQASIWELRIKQLAVISILYLVVTLFLFKWSYLAPKNVYEAAQLTISKALIFSVGAYLLFLSARNFLAHQHNAVVNRHRQNALLTFKSLTDAAGSTENRDIVLTHAAACIFSAQETGYMRSSQGTNVTNLVESIPKFLQGAPGASSN